MSEIAWRCALLRPDRCAAGDYSWAEELALEIGSRVPLTQLLVNEGLRQIKSEQSVAYGRANAIMREIGQTRQWPTAWGEFYGAQPLAIVHDDGNREIVLLRSASFLDVRQWEFSYRREAGEQFNRANTAANGAQWLLEQMPQSRWETKVGDAMREHATEIVDRPELDDEDGEL